MTRRWMFANEIPDSSGMIVKSEPAPGLRRLELGTREVQAFLHAKRSQLRSPVGRNNSLVNGVTPELCDGCIEDWSTLDFTNAIIDPGPSYAGHFTPYLKVAGPFGSRQRVYAAVVPQDRFWVAEIWCQHAGIVTHLADGDWILDAQAHGSNREEAWLTDKVTWMSASQMPRWACRLTLEVHAVEVERLVDSDMHKNSWIWVYNVSATLGAYDDEADLMHAGD